MNRKIEANGRRGSVTLMALVFVVALMILCGAVLSNALRSQQEQGSAVERHRADFTADAGIAHAVTNLTNGDTGDLGSEDAPLAFGGGSYWATVLDNGDDTFLVTSTGSIGNETARIEARLEPKGGGIYHNAIFAGNDSGDPLYTLDLGGADDQADDIDGDVYSGGDLELWGDATVDGTIRASGEIDGASGEEGTSQPIPDLAAMDYESTADFDVAALFAAEEIYKFDGAGGYAYQVPEDNPAHIFRLNPSDRSSNTSATKKDDYFLEDPYEPVQSDAAQDGSNPYTFTLSGVSGEPGPDSNGKVFYIDGNLWLHNKKTYSLGLSHSEAGGVQVTFVVKGNIYFSDNLFYDDPAQDGLAFIAMEDPNVEDSGNIYFGDPVYGTLQEMHAFMYAENDFYDVNLDASGSTVVELYGNMTAGNQVLIDRDAGGEHTKLHVDFDERIMNGALAMPGLPGNGGGAVHYVVTYWHRIAAP